MWESIASAGIGALGSLIGGGISAGGTAAQNSASQQYALQTMRENNQFNAQQAQINRDFQERMSNSAYQRAMADMRLAGLNPILAYQQGGAGTPGGASASANSPVGAQFENAMEGIGRGVTSASKGSERAIELQNTIAQTSTAATQADLNKANANLSKANEVLSTNNSVKSAAEAAKANAETANIIASADNPAAMRALMKAQETSAYSAATKADTETKWLDRTGGGGIIGKNTLGVGSAILDTIFGLQKHAKPAQPVGGRGPDNSFPNLWNKVFGK